MKQWIKRTLLAAGMATALVATGSVIAQGMPHHGPQAGPGHMLERAEALKKDLNLSASQQALWDIAVEKTKTAMQGGRQLHKQTAENIKTQLASGNADLRALAAQMDTQRDAARAKQKDVRDAWLNLYDKLDTPQRAKVNAMLAQMMERRHKMHGR